MTLPLDPGPGIRLERLRLDILTPGRDFAVVNLIFRMRGRGDLPARQAQAWLRFPDAGWKVVSVTEAARLY